MDKKDEHVRNIVLIFYGGVPPCPTGFPYSKKTSLKIINKFKSDERLPLAPANRAKPAMHIRHPAGNELPPEGEGACHL